MLRPLLMLRRIIGRARTGGDRQWLQPSLKGRSWLLTCVLGVWIVSMLLLGAQPLRLAVLGDSLSAEYESISGQPGIDDPSEYGAISVPGWESMSWVEVLGRLRADELDFGVFDADLVGWGPMRFSGYEYNFAIPGFEASQFEEIVTSSILDTYFFYRVQLSDVLQHDVDAVVVWLGANEFRANYGFLYDGGDPLPLVTGLTNDLATILSFVQGENPGAKVVVVTLPDLGATPDKQSGHPDPVKRLNVTAATILANQAISNLAAGLALPLADVFPETYRLVLGEPVWLGSVDLFAGSHVDNHPRYQFTRDGLHPNTCLQAIIARRILETYNQAYGIGATPITDGEILDLIGVDRMQVYLDWVSVNTLVEGEPGDDGDRDWLVNLAEFVFDLDPNVVSPSPLMVSAAGPAVQATYQPDLDRERLVSIRPEWGVTFGVWGDVPPGNLSTNASGAVTVTFPVGEQQRFVRLQLSVRDVE